MAGGKLITSYWPYTGYVLGIASFLSMFMAWFLYFRIYHPPDDTGNCAKCYENIKNHTTKYDIKPDACNDDNKNKTCFVISSDKGMYAHASEPSAMTLYITTAVTVLGIAGVIIIKQKSSSQSFQDV